MIPSSNFVDQIMASLASIAITAAEQAVLSLIDAFGLTTEPDFRSILPVYDRMLAIALLLAGAVIAGGLIERILGGGQGLGWNAIWRSLGACFLSFSGLNLVAYVSGYAALLGNAWDLDFVRVAKQLKDLGTQMSLAPAYHHLPMGSLLGLILTGFLTDLMALLIYLELVVRSALILIVAAFLPLVAVMAIWPRLAGALVHMCEFLLGLLLSKFVVATAVYIGFGLIVGSVASVKGQEGNWMMMGLAVLFIAAFSPVVLVAGLRFGHSTGGSLVRGWASSATTVIPLAAIGSGTAKLLSSPWAKQARQRVGAALAPVVRRLRIP